MFLIPLLSRLPLKVLYAIGNVLAFFARHVVRYRLAVVRHNVALCFPDLSAEARESIVRGFYRHLAEVIVETVWMGGCDRKRFHDQRLVEFLNPELTCRLTEGGRSMVILSSHYGNWELSGGIFASNYTDSPYGFGVNNYIVVYKKLSSEKWNRFMAHNRVAPLDDPEHYEGYLETNEVLRHVVQHRHEQKVYNFITDQHPYRAAKGTLPVTFLGQQCQTMAAAANLAQRFGFSVVYQRMLSAGRGHYTIEYVPISSDASTTTAQEIMDRYYELLSADIKSQPRQYMWSHKRFR